MGLKPGPLMLTWALEDASLVKVGGNKTADNMLSKSERKVQRGTHNT